jgi:hypothetical protein
MADTAAPNLTALTGAGTAADDQYVVHDTSANILKKQTPAELMAALALLGDVATQTELDAAIATTVLKSLYDAQTVLAATTDNTPAALTVAVDQVVGRLTGGNVASLGVNVFPQTLNAQTGTSYVLNASDVGKLVTCSNASAITFVIEGDGTLTWPVGGWCEIYQLGAGQVTVTASGSTIRSTPTLKARAQYSRLFAQKIAASTWALSGDLAAT